MTKKISRRLKKHPVVFSVVTLIIIILLLKTISFLTNIPYGNNLFDNHYKKDILARKAYLVSQLRKGRFAVNKMPPVGDLFQGEWALVTASMTASALTNIAFRYPETRESAVSTIDKIVQTVLSKEFRNIGQMTWGKDPLTELSPDNTQIWYLAHLGIALAAFRFCGGDGHYDTLLSNINKAMLQALEQAPLPYLETYPQEVYSADNTVMYASLKRYDQIFNDDHAAIYDRWLSYSKAHLLDPTTGIIKSYVNDVNDPHFNSRGSWVGWMSFYLPIIDTAFANDQYDKARKHFFSTVFGFRICREFPGGIDIKGDIDSGPVIFGASPSGTAFIIGGATYHDDIDNLIGFLTTAEFIGTSVSFNGKKQYLFAPLVGDAIMLAMRTAVVWDKRYFR